MSGGLAAQLRAGTADLHRVAERSGIMRQILVDRALTRAGYARLLRSLHAIYAELEAALDRHRAHPGVAPVYFPELARADRLVADLQVHHGHGWEQGVSPAPSAARYARRLRALTRRAPTLLVAHAYVRYLGDLSGGQLLPARIAGAARVAPDAGFAFYAFPDVTDPAAFKARYRAALDGLPLDAACAARVVDEARRAFALHARLFEELAD